MVCEIELEQFSVGVKVETPGYLAEICESRCTDRCMQYLVGDANPPNLRKLQPAKPQPYFAAWVVSQGHVFGVFSGHTYLRERGVPNSYFMSMLPYSIAMRFSLAVISLYLYFGVCSVTFVRLLLLCLSYDERTVVFAVPLLAVVEAGTEGVPVGADIGTIVHLEEDIAVYQQAQGVV